MWPDRIIFGFSLFWVAVTFLWLIRFQSVSSIAVSLLQVAILIQQWRQQKWAFGAQIGFCSLVALYLLLLLYVLGTGRSLNDPLVTSFVAVVAYINSVVLLAYSIIRIARWDKTTW
jgi:hypothetical protein